MATIKTLPKKEQERLKSDLHKLIELCQEMCDGLENMKKPYKLVIREAKQFLKGQRSTQQLGKLLIWHKKIILPKIEEPGTKRKLRCPICNTLLIQLKYNLWGCSSCDKDFDADELGINAEDYP